ncbi:FxsA family protein [Bacillus manliponensis]|uniref:FxsA family protein n=1 Tax=Bacillus manliponensis TaxID=574376 RepID=UPI003512535E
MKWFLLLLIVVPALEITLLVGSSQLIGLWPTFIVIMCTGVLGAYLAKRQGLIVLQEIRERMSYGELPGDALLDGICILIGGVLLLTPGYVTDFIGFMLLVSITRKPLKYMIYKWMEKKISKKSTIIVQK